MALPVPGLDAASRITKISGYYARPVFEAVISSRTPPPKYSLTTRPSFLRERV